MKKISKIFVFAMVVLLLASTVNCGYAQTKPELVMEVGTFHPSGTGDVKGLEYFKRIVEERSEQKIKVNVYFGKTLGAEEATVDQCRLGTLHLVIDGMGTMGRFASKFGAWTVPYTYPDKETLLKSTKGPIGEAIRKVFEDNGLIFIGIYVLGYRNLTTNRRAIHPEVLEGMKLRLPAIRDWIYVWEKFDCLPTPVPAPEMFLALQTGLVEAQENPFATIHVRHLWEVQKYVILTHHVIDFHILVLSKKFMDGIQPEFKDLIIKAAGDTLKWCGEYAEELDTKYMIEAQDKGMTLIIPDRAAYRKIAIKALDKIKENWEPWVYDQLMKETSD